MPNIKITNTGESPEYDPGIDEDFDPATQELLPAERDQMGAPLDGGPNDDSEGENGEENGEELEDEDFSNLPSDARMKEEMKKYLREIGKAGKSYGLGKISMIELVDLVVDGAMQNVIKPNDAGPIYKKFRQAAQSAAVLADNTAMLGDKSNESLDMDTGVKSKDQQISKLRSFIKFGNAYREDDGLATDIIARARKMHIALRESDDKDRLKLKSTYAMLKEIASHHLKDEWTKPNGVRGMTDDELRGHMLNPEKPGKEAADLIKIALENAVKARKGKEATDKAPGRSACDHPDLDDAITSLEAVLGALAPELLREFEAKQKKTQDDAAVAAFRLALTHKN